MDMFNLAQLTKHMVVKGVRDAEKEPYTLAQDTVRETLRTYLKGMNPGSPEVRQGVKEVARGVMTGLLLTDLAMPPAALAVLQAVSELTAELPHDPEMLMASTIEGIAEMRLLLSLEILALIQNAIEVQYMGSGEAFRKCLDDKGTRDEQIVNRSRAVS